MNFQKSSVPSDLDPRLQWIVNRRSRGLSTLKTSSTNAGDIAVVARVADVARWSARSDVQMGGDLGQVGQDYIVTGRIPVARIEDIRQDPNVKSLKPPHALHPVLTHTPEDIRCRQQDLPAGTMGKQGAGAVVGIIDFGCDFAHDNFRNSDGTSRILTIWNQNAATSPGAPFGYGQVFTQAQINAALKEAGSSGDPYKILGYGPDPDVPGQSPGTHGTHVMDIAAGNGGGSGLPGVAPAADIIFVELAASDVPWSGGDVVGKTFGDSVQLLEAILFIFDQAGNRPCVINVSLGTNGGPHDGSTLVELGIDAQIASKPNRAVVIAASNSFDDGIHGMGKISQGEAFDIPWHIVNSDPTHNELEIWYAKEDVLDVELIASNGASIGTVRLGESGEVKADDGRLLAFVAHRKGDPQNGDNVIGIFLETGLISGQWTVRLTGRSVQNGAFHAWVERDDPGQSSILSPVRDDNYTLGSISCGRNTIVVGSYDGHKASKPLSWFSSAGPTRDDRQKPEVSAPGHAVLAAHSRSRTGTVSKSGTSMASPTVAGVLALMMSEAKARGLELSIENIQEILAKTSRPDFQDGEWNDRYGRGRIDAAAIVQQVIDLAETPTV